MKLVALLHGGPLNGHFMTVEDDHDLRIIVPGPEGTTKVAVYYPGEVEESPKKYRLPRANYWYRELE